MKKRRILITAAAVATAAVALVLVLLFSNQGGLKATFSSFQHSDSVLELYRDERFVKHYKKILGSMYGFTGKEVDSVLSGSGSWVSYLLDVNVVNKTSGPVTIYSYEIPDNGKDRIWICTISDGEIGIPKDATQNVSITILVNDKNISEKQIEETVKGYGIRVVYSPSPEIDTDGNEIPQEKLSVAIEDN